MIFFDFPCPPIHPSIYGGKTKHQFRMIQVLRKPAILEKFSYIRILIFFLFFCFHLFLSPRPPQPQPPPLPPPPPPRHIHLLNRHLTLSLNLNLLKIFLLGKNKKFSYKI